MPPIGNPHATFEQDEAFRQSVIRKALLLGFSAYQIDRPKMKYSDLATRVWAIDFNGASHEGYASIYSAAYDYLRLMKVPPEVIGDYRG